MIRVGVLFVVMSFAAFCSAQEARWIVVPKIRSGTDTTIVAEITNRCPSTSLMRGEDRVGQGHYGSHQINAYIRNKYGRGTGRDNAAYVPGGYAFIAPEPSQFTLHDVIRGTSTPLPGGNIPVADWNRQPLYIFDELSAYTCGTVSGIRFGQSHSLRTRTSFKFAKVLLAHARIVVQLARERKYQHSGQLDGFVSHIEKIHESIEMSFHK